MPMRSRFSFALFAALTAAGAGLVGACSNQGEGEPCNPNSDDCQSQYQCIPVANNGNRCCPILPAQPAPNSICAPNNTGVNNSNVLPEGGEGGGESGADASAPDSTPAAETGSPLEASTDAPATVDAPPSDGAGEAAADGPAE